MSEDVSDAALLPSWWMCEGWGCCWKWRVAQFVRLDCKGLRFWPKEFSCSGALQIYFIFLSPSEDTVFFFFFFPIRRTFLEISL